MIIMFAIRNNLDMKNFFSKLSALGCALGLLVGSAIDQEPKKQQEQAPVENPSKQLVQLADKMKSIKLVKENRDLNSSALENQRQLLDQLRTLVEQVSQSKPSSPQKAAANRTTDAARQPGADQSNSERDVGQTGADTETPPSRSQDIVDRELIDQAWGDLPARVRDRLATGLQPQFHPKYERLIREYYRRMAGQNKK